MYPGDLLRRASRVEIGIRSTGWTGTETHEPGNCRWATAILVEVALFELARMLGAGSGGCAVPLPGEGLVVDAVAGVAAVRMRGLSRGGG